VGHRGLLVTSFLAILWEVLNKEKAGYFVPGFFFVAECVKLSNHQLVTDLANIIDLLNNIDNKIIAIQ
jgi:hypothetical protein